MTNLPPETTVPPLRDYIEETLLNGRAVADDEDLLLSGLLDSLAVMSLVSFIEQRFGLQVPFDDVVIEHFESIAAMATYLQGRAQDA